MAWTVDIKKIFAGRRKQVIHIVGNGDGSAAELTDTILVNASDETHGVPPVTATYMTVEKIEYNTDGVELNLRFDATVDDELAMIPDNDAGELCWRNIGGNTDPQSAGSTGDILLTTDKTVANASFTLTLHVRPKS